MGERQELRKKSHTAAESGKATGNIHAYVCLILKKFTAFISSAKQ
jgi:hypothetical protein